MNIYLNHTASSDQTLLFSSQELSSYLKKMLPQSHIQASSTPVPCNPPDICISLLTYDESLDTITNDSFQINITQDGGYIKGPIRTLRLFEPLIYPPSWVILIWKESFVIVSKLSS